MRRIGLLLLMVFLPVAAFPSGTNTYTHPVFLYALDYPETWRVREMGKAVSFSAPPESETDKFSENVQVVVEDLSALPQEVSLVDYHRAGLASAQKFLTDFKPLEEARTQWLDRDTIVMLYSATVRGERFKFKDYKFMVGKEAYVLTYTARQADFDAVLSKAESVMRSIRVSP
jgi:hypothetical protein